MLVAKHHKKAFDSIRKQLRKEEPFNF